MKNGEVSFAIFEYTLLFFFSYPFKRCIVRCFYIHKSPCLCVTFCPQSSDRIKNLWPSSNCSHSGIIAYWFVRCHDNNLLFYSNCLCFCSGHSTATHRSFYSYTSVRNRFCSHIYSNCLSHFQNHTFLSWKFYLEIEAYFRYNLFVLSRFGIPTAYPMISGIALQSDAAFYS